MDRESRPNPGAGVTGSRTQDKAAYKYSRRAVLRLTLGVAGAGILAACGASTNTANNTAGKPPGARSTAAQPGAKSSPMEATNTGTPTSSASVVTGGGTSSTTASTATKAPVTTQAPAPTMAAQNFKESPKISAQVQSGKLPKVTDRLPKSPLVLKPV